MYCSQKLFGFEGDPSLWPLMDRLTQWVGELSNPTKEL